MIKKIKLMADYGCHPLWWTSSAQVGDIDPASLNLSDETIKRLEKWADTYDLKLNNEDPSSSGFPTVEAKKLLKKKEFDYGNCCKKNLHLTTKLSILAKPYVKL